MELLSIAAFVPTGTVTANREAVYAFKGGGFGEKVGIDINLVYSSI